MMKLSVSAWSAVERLQGKEDRCTLEDFIRLCHKLGVEYVELLDVFFEGEEHIRSTCRLLEELNMKVCCYSISGSYVSEEKTEESLAALKKAFEVARLLQTDRIRIFPGVVTEGIEVQDGYDSIVRGLKKATALAEAQGVVLVMENHGTYGGTSAGLMQILQDVGSSALRLNPDVGNFVLAGESSLHAVRALPADSIGMVHFKDFYRCENGQYATHDQSARYQGCVLGQGECDLRQVVQVLQEKGYDGFISIEYEGHELECFSGIEQCVGFACSCIGVTRK